MGSLPDNILIKKLLDRTASTEEQNGQDSYKSAFCTECTRVSTGTPLIKSVRFFCYNCSEYFCQPCHWKHDRSFRNHRDVVDLKVVTDTLRDLCQEHRELAAYYCQKCSRAVCSRCILAQHEYHNVVSMIDRATVAKKNADLKKGLPVLDQNLREACRRTQLI